jgi:bifunctional non-homologous end joining protein LigD
MRRRPGEKDPWLLIKAQDEEARSPDDPDILEDMPLSVASGRSIPEIAEGKGASRVWHSSKSVQENVKAGATRGAASTRRAGGSSRQAARGPRRAGTSRNASKKTTKKNSKDKESRPHGAPLPDFLPSLATLRATAPKHDGWVHEIKSDGYRIQARLDHGEVRLLTRKGLD